MDTSGTHLGVAPQSKVNDSYRLRRPGLVQLGLVDLFDWISVEFCRQDGQLRQKVFLRAKNRVQRSLLTGHAGGFT